jgi:hypothetical protein
MSATALMEPHGFVLLSTGDNAEPWQSEMYMSLRAIGYGPWDGNGRPLFVVLASSGSKSQWFQAGFYAGQGVPLFFVGKSARLRQKHRDAISRSGGWAYEAATPADLLAALVRRDLQPTEWDLAAVE